eukprot:365192-Chlamydomonas_euryale.AAC.1
MQQSDSAASHGTGAHINSRSRTSRCLSRALPLPSRSPPPSAYACSLPTCLKYAPICILHPPLLPDAYTYQPPVPAWGAVPRAAMSLLPAMSLLLLTPTNLQSQHGGQYRVQP